MGRMEHTDTPTFDLRRLGRHAGPHEDRCGGCGLFCCDCPVGRIDQLGYLRCHGCAAGRGDLATVSMLNLPDACDTCLMVLSDAGALRERALADHARALLA